MPERAPVGVNTFPPSESASVPHSLLPLRWAWDRSVTSTVQSSGHHSTGALLLGGRTHAWGGPGKGLLVLLGGRAHVWGGREGRHLSAPHHCPSPHCCPCRYKRSSNTSTASTRRLHQISASGNCGPAQYQKVSPPLTPLFPKYSPVPSPLDPGLHPLDPTLPLLSPHLPCSAPRFPRSTLYFPPTQLPCAMARSQFQVHGPTTFGCRKPPPTGYQQCGAIPS